MIRTKRYGTWVGMFGDQNVRVEIVRQFKHRTRARIVEPGHVHNGVVSDFSPRDIVVDA